MGGTVQLIPVAADSIEGRLAIFGATGAQGDQLRIGHMSSFDERAPRRTLPGKEKGKPT
jgi:hypothetical protein